MWNYCVEWNCQHGANRGNIKHGCTALASGTSFMTGQPQPGLVTLRVAGVKTSSNKPAKGLCSLAANRHDLRYHLP